MARFGTAAFMLVVCIVLSSNASELLVHDIAALPAFFVVCLLVASPILLDLRARIIADREGIQWRNRIVTQKLRWDQVAGFERGPTSMLLRRVDGRRVPLRVLGLRYFGSKKMAVARVAVLEGLRTGR